ncbi:hypothetical protein AWB71_03313 [Caballeronia peredens]|nr:hypothetical protein AWB71_03313 [Caballeronia peredens]
MQIPLYQQQTNVGGGLPLPRAEANPVSAAVGQALEGVARSGDALENGLMIQQKTNERLLDEQREQDAKAWTADAVSNAHLEWQKTMVDRQQAATGSAAGFTPKMLDDFDTYAKESIANAPTPLAQRYMQQSMAALRTQIGTQALNFEANARIGDRIEKQTNSINTWANVVFTDPSQYESALKSIQETMPEVGPEHTNKLLDYAKKTIAYAAATSVARSNPDSIIGAPGSGANAATGGGQYQGGFSGADAFVAQKEGGLLAKDTNNTPTNFGINQAANPDVDVTKLTPEQASQIRKSRYWDAIHADALPPAMQPVAYNFAIQAGAGAANNLLKQADNDPAKFNELAKAYYDKIPADKSQGYLQAWKTRSDEAFKLGGAPAAPADNPVLANLPFEQRLQVWNQAKTQQGQNMALARAQLDTHLQDAQSMAANGVSDPTPISFQQLVNAYGPLEAPAHYRAYQDGQQLAGDVANMKGMPMQDIAGMVNSRAPTAGPGYAVAAHDHQILQSAASQVLQQREADPASYVVKNAPAVQTAQQAFAANPTPQTASAFAQASIAEQQRLGVPKPQVLTKLQAETLTDQINANGGAQADQVIQQQAQLWGDRWGDVFGQLKNVKPVAKVLGYLGSSVDTATRQQVLGAANTPIESLKDGINPADVKSVETKLQSLTQPFAATMAYSLGGASTFGALYDSANRLSLTYLRQGMSPGDATNKAFQALMGGQFNVRDSARIPTQYDADAVMSGAKLIQGNLGGLDLTVPPAPASMRAEDAKSLYVSNLRSGGKWITSADGKSLVLFDPVSQSLVTTRDGKPVGAPFSSLAAPAKRVEADPSTADVPVIPAAVY